MKASNRQKVDAVKVLEKSTEAESPKEAKTKAKRKSKRSLWKRAKQIWTGLTIVWKVIAWTAGIIVFVTGIIVFLATYSPPVRYWTEAQLATVFPLTPTSTEKPNKPVPTEGAEAAAAEPIATETVKPPTTSPDSSPTPLNIHLDEVFEVAARSGADVRLHAETNSSLTLDYTEDCQHRTEPGTLGMKLTFDVAFGTSAHVSFQWPAGAPLNLFKSFFIKLHFFPLNEEGRTIGIVLIDSYGNRSTVQHITSPSVKGWYDPSLDLRTFGVSRQSITEIRIVLDKTETKSLRGSLCLDWIAFN